MQVFRVFDPSTKNLGQSGKEVSARSRKLIAADKPSVIAKSIFDPIVVEDGEGDRCFPNPPCTDESDGFEVFDESNNLLDQLLTPETAPQGRRRRFTGLGDGKDFFVDGCQWYLPGGFYWKHPVLSTHFDGYPRPTCGYLQPPRGYP
jgi:hypothetical protein